MIWAKRLSILAVCLIAAGCGAGRQSAEVAPRSRVQITVAAAASLTDVMKELSRGFSGANPDTAIQFTFDSSGTLERQIEQGAPIDVFVSAGTKEMDELVAKHLIDAGTRLEVATNKLVLICPSSRGASVTDWKDLTKSSVVRIAISDPATVPSGRYAKQTLQHLGLWAPLKSKLVFGENVRQTLHYAAEADVDAAIVFQTDAKTVKNGIETVATARSGVDHQPIVYPAAIVSASPDKDAAAKFVKYLASKQAKPEWERFGF